MTNEAGQHSPSKIKQGERVYESADRVMIAVNDFVFREFPKNSPFIVVAEFFGERKVLTNIHESKVVEFLTTTIDGLRAK